MGAVAKPEQSGGRAGEKHPAVLLLDEMRPRRLGHEKGPDHVDVKHGLKPSEAQVPNICIVEDPGIVDDDMRPNASTANQ